MSLEVEAADSGVTRSPKKLKYSQDGSAKKRKRDTVGEKGSTQHLHAKKPKFSDSHYEHTNHAPQPMKIQPSKADSLDRTPFHSQTFSLYLSLSPISQHHALQGLCAEHLSPLVLTYYHPLNGVVISYSNARLSENPRSGTTNQGHIAVLAKSVDEYAVSFVWITAEFLIFRPLKGGWIKGWINLQNEGHIGLVCWNLFNASIERKRLPKNWRWVGLETNSKRKKNGQERVLSTTESEEHVRVPDSDGEQENEGYFVDGEGNRVSRALTFRIKDVETLPSTDREKGFLSIEGTLLSEEKEASIMEQEMIRNRVGARGSLVRRGSKGHFMTGALSNGHSRGTMDIDNPQISSDLL